MQLFIVYMIRQKIEDIAWKILSHSSYRILQKHHHHHVIIYVSLNLKISCNYLYIFIF